MDRKLNLLYLAILAPASIAYAALVLRVRPDYLQRSRKHIAVEASVSLLATRYPLYAVHEGLHAVVLWAYTRERPEVSLHGVGSYAYAAAPKWWFPRRQYLVVGLTPLATLTPLLLALLPIIPRWLLSALGWMVLRNVAGSHVDIYVAWQLLRHSPETYLNDDTRRFTLWEPQDFPPPR